MFCWLILLFFFLPPSLPCRFLIPVRFLVSSYLSSLSFISLSVFRLFWFVILFYCSSLLFLLRFSSFFFSFGFLNPSYLSSLSFISFSLIIFLRFIPLYSCFGLVFFFSIHFYLRIYSLLRLWLSRMLVFLSCCSLFSGFLSFFRLCSVIPLVSFVFPSRLFPSQHSRRYFRGSSQAFLPSILKPLLSFFYSIHIFFLFFLSIFFPV